MSCYNNNYNSELDNCNFDNDCGCKQEPDCGCNQDRDCGFDDNIIDKGCGCTKKEFLGKSVTETKYFREETTRFVAPKKSCCCCGGRR